MESVLAICDGDAVALRPGRVALPGVEEDRGVVPAARRAGRVLAVRRAGAHALRRLPQGRLLLRRTPGQDQAGGPPTQILTVITSSPHCPEMVH